MDGWMGGGLKRCSTRSAAATTSVGSSTRARSPTLHMLTPRFFTAIQTSRHWTWEKKKNNQIESDDTHKDPGIVVIIITIGVGHFSGGGEIIIFESPKIFGARFEIFFYDRVMTGDDS